MPGSAIQGSKGLRPSRVLFRQATVVVKVSYWDRWLLGIWLLAFGVWHYYYLLDKVTG